MRRDVWIEIRRLRSEGLSARGVAARMGLDRRTVARALASDQPPRRKGAGRPGALERFRSFAMAKLERYPELTAMSVFSALAEAGYAGKYGAVKKFVRELRPLLKPAFHTLRFGPGEMAQVDWGHAGVVRVEGAPRRASLFIMVLCHSRLMFADLFLGEAMEHWLEAHWRAFQFLGGVVSGVTVDNCRTAVSARPPGEEPRLNPRYEDFAAVCGFKIFPCAVRRPMAKGRVEKAVHYVKSGFLAGRGEESFEGRRAALAEWLHRTANRRVHGTTGRIPAELFEEVEKSALQPLPPLPPDRGVETPAQATSQFRVVVDTNRYSVPPRLASRSLTVRRSADKILVYDGEELAAEHARSYGRRLDILNHDHDRELSARTRGARERRAVCALLRLGDAAEAYLAKLRERRGNWVSHAARIVALAEAYGRDEAARALRDALEAEAFSAEYVLSILQTRARPLTEPGPLSLLRGDDLLRIELPRPDIEAYDGWKQEKED
jgi:transposase